MSLFPFLHFFNSIVYIYLAVYIFIKNPKALLNRICVVSFLCFALWSFSAVFFHNPYSSKNIARLFTNIGSPGWVGFSSFFLWFILTLAGKEKILKKKWFYIILFGIPLFFIYIQLTNPILIDFSKEYFGWKPVYSSTTWTYIYFFYFSTFMAAGFYINFMLIKKGKNQVLKKQAVIVFVTAVLTFILGSTTDVLLPLLNVRFIPNIACSLLLIWTFGVAYAMAKYKFLAITPAAAAGDIISTMFDCLILLNTKGEIVFVNKAALKLLQFSQEELQGVPLGTLFAEQSLNRDTIESIISGENLKSEEFVFKNNRGENIPVLFSSSALMDEAGAVGGIVCVARDISDRKKLEEEVLKSKKLESIGILAGGIAHDFNNLLAIVMLNLSLVKDTIDPKEKVYRLLQKAEEISLKAGDLTNKFIPFTPALPLKRKEITLPAVLEKVKDRGLPGAAVTYDFDVPADLYAIYGDADQLERVTRNLFLNAAEAIPGEGKISLRAENTTIKTESKLLLKEGRYVKISITDNGSGIQQDYMEKIFDPYFSTKERISHEGMGLGLTVCYAIIKKHEGHIAVASKKGKGTTVTLYLPAHH